MFISSSISKLFAGGWLPVTLALGIFTLISTWKGQRIITDERQSLEGLLQPYIDQLHAALPKITRVRGTAVYIGHHHDYAPLALHKSVEENHELHDQVIIVTVKITNSAHVPEEERAVWNTLKYTDGIAHLTLDYGYHDVPNVPRTLSSLVGTFIKPSFNSLDAVYFVSMSKTVRTERHNMADWRKHVYCFMDRNALSLSDYLKLPINRTTEVTTLLKL